VAIEVPGVENGEETLAQSLYPWRVRGAAAMRIVFSKP